MGPGQGRKGGQPKGWPLLLGDWAARAETLASAWLDSACLDSDRVGVGVGGHRGVAAEHQIGAHGDCGHVQGHRIDR